MFNVMPCGDTRADIRAAIHTANALASQRVEAMPDADFSECVSRLMNYLQLDNSHELPVDPEALKAIHNAR